MWDAGSVFERFTDEARQVVVAAQEEARGLRHNYIGTEYLLLGFFVNTEAGAGAALTALGLSAGYVRERVAAIVGPGDGQPASGQMPFTPRSKKVLELGLREALNLGHNYIETLHLLLGLARENEGVAMQILLDAGVSAERIRETAIAMTPAGETVDRVRLASAEQARGRQAVAPGVAFTVTPDQVVRRLLMVAAGRALADGRQEFGVEDLRAVIDEQPPSAEAPDDG